MDVGLLTGNHQEIAIGEPFAALKIDLLLIPPRLARIRGLGIALEVCQDRERPEAM